MEGSGSVQIITDPDLWGPKLTDQDSEILRVTYILYPYLQECMDFCAEHNIVPTVELIKANQLDDVYAALEKKNDGVIRYVLDVAASS